MAFQIDILSPDIYLDGVPHDRFARLRKEAPLYWHEEPDGPGFWCVTKFRDVIAISKDTTTFSSTKGGQIEDLPPQDPKASPDMIVNMDPPMHTVYKSIIGQSFTPSVIAKMEPFIRSRMHSLLDELIPRGEFDFMDDFCAKIPMATILQMVGVPERDQFQIQRWVHHILTRDDPEFALPAEELLAVVGKFMGYAHELADERRRSPRDDLLSGLMAAEVDGRRLSYDEFGMFFILLLAAGSHTTFLALGNILQDLLENPKQWALLSQRPSLIPDAVEEELRFNPPITHFRRTATRDVDFNGAQIKIGQKVVLWYASANRDEEIFDAPNDFRIDRKCKDHASFGHGAHFCLGNALARLTLRIAVEIYVMRLSNLKCSAPQARLRSATFNGMKKMPVSIRR